MAKKGGDKRSKISLVQSLARQGKTFDQIKSTLQKEYGSAYRKTDMLSDMRSATGRSLSETKRRASVPRKYRSYNYDTDPVQTQRNWVNKYNHMVTYDLYNKSTRQKELGLFVTISTNNPNMTVNEIEDQARQLILENLNLTPTGSPSIFAILRGSSKPDKWHLYKHSVKYVKTIERED